MQLEWERGYKGPGGKGGGGICVTRLLANATLDEAFLQAAPWDAVVGLTAALTPQRTQVDQGGCWTCEVAWGSGELES